MKSATWKQGQRMRDLREARGFTQAQIAELAGVTTPMVVYWEGDKMRPSYFALYTITKHYGMTIAQAFPGYAMTTREKRIIKAMKAQ